MSSPISGMPDGKAAGERCIHLNDEYLCLIFDDPGRPTVCDEFSPSEENCGNSRSDALGILSELEAYTSEFENED